MTDDWLPDLTQPAGGTKYRAIASALGSAIERGELRAGDRLPPQRELAARLGVDLTTVTKAYDEARRSGLIEARGRMGSFVRERAQPVGSDAASVDAGMNMPPELPGGMLSDAIQRTIARLAADGAGPLLHYRPAGGAPVDRVAGAILLAGSGLAAAEEQVVVAAGGQNALHGILASALRPGDAIACGRFVYSGFRALADRLGLRLVPIDPVSADALEEACRRERISALYVVPTNDNPTAATLGLKEREAIAETARRHDVTIIEDDAYGPLAADRAAPISAFAPELSWYVASTSKTISPALRLAFVRCPSVGAGLRLSADIHETAIMPPPLSLGLVGAWLGDGTYDRLVDAMRTEAGRRQAIAREILGDLRYQSHPEGYHLWLPLDGAAAADLVDAMRPTGLSVVSGERFRAGEGADQFVRVSLGGPIDRPRLARALRILHGHVAAPLARAGLLV